MKLKKIKLGAYSFGILNKNALSDRMTKIQFDYQDL